MRRSKAAIGIILTAFAVLGRIVPVNASSGGAEAAHFHVYDQYVYCGIDYENVYLHDVYIIDEGSETHTTEECLIIEQHEVYKLKCECGAVYEGYSRIKVICDHSICDNESYWLN